MKKLISLLIALFCVAFGLIGSCIADQPERDVLSHENGNFSGWFSMEVFGLDSFMLAEAMKFTAPRSDWTLDGVRILGWDEYVENETLPAEKIIALEIRDEELNLLYSFTDSQLAHFNYPGLVEIEIPPISIDGDFYVCFYDRGAMSIGVDQDDPSGNSFIFVKPTKELKPAAFLTDNSEESVMVDWIIRAVGH